MLFVLVEDGLGYGIYLWLWGLLEFCFGVLIVVLLSSLWIGVGRFNVGSLLLVI